MSVFSSLTRFIQDPPPEYVFEIAPDMIRMAQSADPSSVRAEPLPAGVISPSPLHDNVVLAEPFNQAVARLAVNGQNGSPRTAALILPDHCAHIAVLDFDNFPEKVEEQLSLIRFRLKRNVPFDMESAALSYWIQGSAERGSKARREVVVAVTALEIVSRYEAPFRANGFHPGLVTLAPIALLDLIDTHGIVAVARVSGRVLTLLGTRDGVLKVIRSIELAEVSLPEISSHLHQTLAFVEDNLGGPARELCLAGFGTLEAEAIRELPAELQMPVRVLGGDDTALRGYLKGVNA